MNSESAVSASRFTDTAAAPPAAEFRPRPKSAFRKGVMRTFAELKLGRLRLELPDGQSAVFGDPAWSGFEEFIPLGTQRLQVASEALIRVRSEAFFKRCALAGDIGFAESYLNNEWDSPDLTAVIAWFIRNLEAAPVLSGSARAKGFALNIVRFGNRLGHLLRGNTKEGSRRNIRDHYDLSNEFFALFLDSSMMYSAARWSRPDMTLEEAQREKNDALCQKLRLKPTDHVLEIGSGWGGWALHAARNYGCRVTSCTISQQQLEKARSQISEAGLADKVDIQFRDYRDITGRFDKLVSIEMLEAVGHDHLPRFCETANRVLASGGLMAMQFITCPDSRYREFRQGVDFIQKHIFPGSLLLSLNRVNEQLSKAGGFILHGVEDMGQDYALTLKAWHKTFQSKLGEVRALGFDERFLRKWCYYFCYCEAAFALRNISVVQTVHTRPNNLSL